MPQSKLRCNALTTSLLILEPFSNLAIGPEQRITYSRMGEDVVGGVLGNAALSDALVLLALFLAADTHQPKVEKDEMGNSKKIWLAT